MARSPLTPISREVKRHRGDRDVTLMRDPLDRERDENLVRSLERGMAVIEALGEPGPGRTASDIAAELGLSRTTTYRALGTLCGLGLVRHDAGRYALTPKVLELGCRQWSGLDLAQTASRIWRSFLSKPAKRARSLSSTATGSCAW
jgi:IclR helix-turn-helix domain